MPRYRPPAGTGLRAMLRAFRHPVLPETHANLARLRDKIPPALRDARQMIGRHAEGCGATIGAAPRCDFACTGCYLSSDANSTPGLALEELKEQLQLLRAEVGRFGNVQLTDGEVTLLEPDELVALARTARDLELMPMLMTHGDVLRRRPELLERLVVEGGLREVSFHVDTTQRGRRGSEYKYATDERELHPLRDELAELIRGVRRKTRLDLRAAMTVTVTPDNLEGVAEICSWVLANSDAIRILSFQPVAQVGRTHDGLSGGGVDVDRLWHEIARGLAGDPAAWSDLRSGELWFGHPECSRVVNGLAMHDADGSKRYLPLRRLDDPASREPYEAFLDRWGGITFRGDEGLVGLARLAGMLVQSPGLFASQLPRYTWRWLQRLEPGAPLRGLLRLALRRRQLHGVAFVSHHFMDAEELATPRGQEREASCVFLVPMDGELRSMCRVNAAGDRKRLYTELRARHREQLDSLSGVGSNPAPSSKPAPASVPFSPHQHP